MLLLDRKCRNEFRLFPMPCRLILTGERASSPADPGALLCPSALEEDLAMSRWATRSRLMKTHSIAFCLMALGIASAPLTHAESVVLQNVRVIDGNGGPPIEHADILIKGDRITAVNASGRVAVPAGATVVNLSGKTAVPGLISDHSHLGLVDGASATGQNVTRANILRQLRQYEAFGVTSVTSLGLNLQPFYDLQPGLHLGAMPGADIFGADRGFGVDMGAPPTSMGILNRQVYRPSTVEDARLMVRETARRHPDLIKIWVDDMHGTVPNKMNPVIYKAVIDEAHANHLRVAAHIFYLDDAKRLVSDGVDILAHGVRDKPVDTTLIQAMKARGVWYIPTLSLDETFFIFAEYPAWMQQPFFRHALQPELAAQFDDPAWRAKKLADTKTIAEEKAAFAMNMQNVKTMYAAGVKIGFGTDSGATPLRIAGFAEHRELQLLTDAGLTPLQAIGTATKNAAALLALDDRGVIGRGKLADLLIVDGDPSKHIADVDRIAEVWHRGKQVANTINTFSP
jgi:imidazolonepropionase-like amidohydrolase